MNQLVPQFRQSPGGTKLALELSVWPYPLTQILRSNVAVHLLFCIQSGMSCGIFRKLKQERKGENSDTARMTASQKDTPRGRWPQRDAVILSL